MQKLKCPQKLIVNHVEEQYEIHFIYCHSTTYLFHPSGDALFVLKFDFVLTKLTKYLSLSRCHCFGDTPFSLIDFILKWEMLL